MVEALAEAPAAKPIVEISKEVIARPDFQAQVGELEKRIGAIQTTSVEELLEVLEPQVEGIIMEMADEEAIIAFVTLVASGDLDLH